MILFSELFDKWHPIEVVPFTPPPLGDEDAS